MPTKFQVKNAFYMRGKLIAPGQAIEVPDELVESLRAKQVLGVSLDVGKEEDENKKKSSKSKTKKK